MTTTPPTVLSAVAAGAVPAGAPARDSAAARQFEGLFVRQLLTALRKTVPEGGMLGGEGDSSRTVVLDMIDDALASALSEGGGIGLAQALEASFSGSPTQGTTHTTTGAPFPLTPRVTTSALVPNGPEGEQLRGATGLLQGAAAPMVSDDAARRWSRDGTLGPQDLASPIATPLEHGGVARFNVRDALGYQGYYKCNLFAFELARRAGFQVPVVARSRGYGYMGADTVARDAGDDGRVRGEWARVATGESAATLDAGIARGQRAFLLAASSPGERPGHMAVVERVRSVEYGTQGEVRRIVFDGWEAKPNGARHLVQRTWNVIGNEGGTQPHNGFDLIQILELRHAGPNGRPEIPVGRPGPSANDDSSSRSGPDRPNTALEEQP